MKNQTDPRRKHHLHAIRKIGWMQTVALIATVVATWAWLSPTTTATTSPVDYRTVYSFDYETPYFPGSTLYGDDSITFGDPIFFAVTDSVDVDVSVAFETKGSQISEATLLTKVVVSSDLGWSQVLLESPVTTLEASSATTTVPVNFGLARNVAKELAETSGVEGEVHVTVIVSWSALLRLPPEVEGGGDRRTTSVASLAFDLEDKVAILHGRGRLSPLDVVDAIEAGEVVIDNENSNAGDAGLAGLATQTAAMTMQQTQTSVRTASVGRWNISVEHLRLGASAVLGLMLAFALYDLVILRIARRRGEAVFLDTRYGAESLTLRRVPDSVLGEAVAVGSFDTLTRMAGGAEAEILHYSNGGGDRYFVFDGPRVFVYEAATDGVESGTTTHGGVGEVGS